MVNIILASSSIQALLQVTVINDSLRIFLSPFIL
jgi:hypothetical protein